MNPLRKALANPRVWWYMTLPLDIYDTCRYFSREADARRHWMARDCEYTLIRCRKSTMQLQAARHNRAVKRFRERTRRWR